MDEDDKQSSLSRRTIIASAVLVPVGAIQSAAQPAAPIFTSAERRILEAFLSRLMPNDEYGPGAVECGAAGYFERQLADELNSEKDTVLQGLAATDAFARLAHGAGLAELPPEKQDAVLTAVQENRTAGFKGSSTVFFNRMRRLTLEGAFGDPYYGGNKNFAGWDLIRYPGVRLAVSVAEQKMAPVKPALVSAWGRDYGH